ncbi:hypothetical protein [uncultured Muribaculum sp.]|nr:hypothetical protein [uncultured Muribaculum sp.]
MMIRLIDRFISLADMGGTSTGKSTLKLPPLISALSGVSVTIISREN